jgi:hypothetical protein
MTARATVGIRTGMSLQQRKGAQEHGITSDEEACSGQGCIGPGCQQMAPGYAGVQLERLPTEGTALLLTQMRRISEAHSWRQMSRQGNSPGPLSLTDNLSVT